MYLDELRERALSIVQISTDFTPIIEECFEGENGTGEAMFSWINEEKDKGITINLDLDGNLTGLTIEMDDSDANTVPLHVEERKEEAEKFLLCHYPDALSYLTFYEMKKFDLAYRFYYERLVMNLPLAYAGSFIDVDPAGNITKFSYKTAGEIPEIPTTFIPKERLLEHVRNTLDFQLLITPFTTMDEDMNDGPHLVYQPEPSFMKYKADVLSPTLSIIQEEDVPDPLVSLHPPSNTAVQNNLSIEEIIGITEGMEVIREVDMGGETGIVWRDRNWKMEEQDLSVDGFFKRQTEGTVKAFVSKDTRELRSFMWFRERSGDLSLTREECLQKAIDFLQVVIPDYYKYLKLIDRVDDEVEDTRKKEVFSFNVHNENGIPVQLEIVMVAVNRETGQIDHYSGPSFDMKDLNEVPAESLISKEKAREIFFNHLDLELAWNKDYSGDTASYMLVYQGYDRYSGASIRYINALTGDVILAKEK